MSIESDGFLSNDVDNIIIKTNSYYKDTFNYCRELNVFAQGILYRLDIRNGLINELIIGAAYIRLLSSYQGSILMAERGMTNEMKVLSRNYLEMVFLICAISNNKEIARSFLLNDEIQRKKLLNKYKNMDPSYVDINSLPEVNKVIEEVMNNIKTQKIAQMSVEILSKEAKLHNHYKSYYSILSLSVHPSARELQETFTWNDNNKIVSINYGSNDKDVEKILLTNCSCMLNTLNHINVVFPIKIEENIINMKTKFDIIWQSKYK